MKQQRIANNTQIKAKRKIVHDPMDILKCFILRLPHKMHILTTIQTSEMGLV